MAVPRILVRQEGGADHAGTQHAGGRTDRSELVEPVQRSGAHRAGTPRRRREPRRAGRHRADRRIPRPAWRGGCGAVSDAQRQRLLHAPEGERCRRVRQLAQCARRQRRLGQQRPAASAAAHLNAFDVYQVGFDASWEVDLWGKVRRSVESATASVVASAEARRAHAAQQPGRTRARLHPVARHAVAAGRSHATT